VTKRVLVVAAAILTTLLALLVVWQFRTALAYVLLSVALAATLRPLVPRWSGRNWLTRLASILLILAALAALAALVFFTGRLAAAELQQLARTLVVRGAWILPPWLENTAVQHALATWLPTPDKLVEAVTGPEGQLLLPALLGFTAGVGSLLSGLIVVLLLSVYWGTSQIHFERLWLSLLPSETRTRARGIWRAIESELGAYIRSEAIQSVAAALLLGTGYWLLGSPYPALLGLIGALAWLIPVVGAALAIIMPFSLGLLTSPQLRLYTTLYTLVVLIALQVSLEPRLFRHKRQNPVLTLILILAMADAFGWVGILLAPPLSTVCQILWTLLVTNRAASGAAAQVSDLRERQARLRAAIEEMVEEPPPLVLSSMERLADLLAKAEPVLQAALPAEPVRTFQVPLPRAARDGKRP